jgi:hypothetical protein
VEAWQFFVHRVAVPQTNQLVCGRESGPHKPNLRVRKPRPQPIDSGVVIFVNFELAGLHIDGHKLTVIGWLKARLDAALKYLRPEAIEFLKRVATFRGWHATLHH